MTKFYFCKTVGDGSNDSPFIPSISLYTDHFIGTDARSDASIGGWMMVECPSISNVEHEFAISDDNIVYFDVENIGFDDKVALIPDRTRVKESLEAQGISIDGLTSDSTLRDVLKSIVRQLLVRQNPDTNTTKTHYDN